MDQYLHRLWLVQVQMHLLYTGRKFTAQHSVAPLNELVYFLCERGGVCVGGGGMELQG